MYSATRVNQFEMKDTCFEFVIDVSRQGNNMKIKLNLKIDLQSCSTMFCEINNRAYIYQGLFITLYSFSHHRAST